MTDQIEFCRAASRLFDVDGYGISWGDVVTWAREAGYETSPERVGGVAARVIRVHAPPGLLAAEWMLAGCPGRLWDVPPLRRGAV